MIHNKAFFIGWWLGYIGYYSLIMFLNGLSLFLNGDQTKGITFIILAFLMFTMALLQPIQKRVRSLIISINRKQLSLFLYYCSILPLLFAIMQIIPVFFTSPSLLARGSYFWLLQIHAYGGLIYAVTLFGFTLYIQNFSDSH